MTPNYDTYYLTPRFPGCEVERYVAEHYDIREINYDFALFCKDYWENEYETLKEDEEEILEEEV